MSQEAQRMESNDQQGLLPAKQLIRIVSLMTTGFFVMSFIIVISMPILSAVVAVKGTDLIAGNLVFGYIFGSVLYIERIRSKDLRSLLRRRGAITTLTWIVLYIIGIAWAVAAGGL